MNLVLMWRWLAAASVLFSAVLFGRLNSEGLQPDAALYAGLSLKVLKTQEFWFLSGSPAFFPQFFEHPPFFFQWGAGVLNWLGVSEFSARAIGGIPAFFGLIFFLGWMYRRMGWRAATLGALGLASFGHFTKYVAAPLLEAPLTLGVALAWVGAMEFLESPKNQTRSLWWCLAALGVALSSASKGVVGLGVWGAIAGFWILFKAPRAWLSGIVLLSVGLLPLGLWALMTWQGPHEPWPFMQYLESQVLRSFTTNRMNPSHADGGSLFYYLGVVIRYGWPWWWLVPLGWILALRRNTILARRSLEARALGLGLLFFLAFMIPFSLSQFQLPHYIHPTYLALAPTAVWAWQNLKWVNFKTEKWARWSLSGFGILVWLGMTLTTPPMSRTSNRGVEFAKSQSQVLELASAQQLFLHPQEIDAYRAEANTLWYWRGRAWKWSDSQEAFEFPNPSECRFSPESALVYCRP